LNQFSGPISGGKPENILEAAVANTAALPSVAEMRQILGMACRRRVDSIFELAKLCLFIKSSYRRAEQTIAGAMDRPKFDRLAKVAADERLRAIEQLLP